MALPVTSLTIRDLIASDEGAWRRLWAGYCAFYEATVPEAVTVSTWKRLMTPGHPMFGRIAVLIGFAVSVLHEGARTVHPICYLEDLFVDETARGYGIGRALIADLASTGEGARLGTPLLAYASRKHAGAAALR